MDRPVPAAGQVLPAPTLLAKGIAALRIFFGVILLANGLAKVFGWHDIRVGWYRGNLVNRADARFILDAEVNRSQGGEGTRLPLLKSIVNDFVLPNWDVFQWLLTVAEVGVGFALVVGFACRLAALVGLGQTLFLAAIYFSSNRWAFEQPHDYVPLAVLALVPSGRIWGVDGWLTRTRKVPQRWPF